MQTRLSYKSKRTIVIAVIIIALLAFISVSAYFFVKGNKDTTAAFTENNMQSEENLQGENQSTSEHKDNNDGITENEESDETATSENEQNDDTSDIELPNAGDNDTEGETTGDVPNEEYVTERVEKREVLVGEDYAVEWSPLTIEATTTTTNLSLIRPIITQSKIANKTAVVENDIITYTISVENSGTGDGMVLIKDDMPKTSKLVTFIDGSIKIKGTDIIKVADKEISINDKEIAKLTADDLNNGIEVNVPKAIVEDTKITNGLVTINFEVRVRENAQGTIINKAQVNDEETNEVKVPIFTYSKDVDKKIVKFNKENQILDGNEIEYTITVENKQEIEGNIIVRDCVPEGTEFVEKSIKIYGTDTIKIEEQTITVTNKELEKLAANNLKNGIEVKVPAKGSVKLKFKVKPIDINKSIKNIAYINEQPTEEVTTNWEGIEVVKERTEIVDVDNRKGLTFVDQVGDIIKYNITVRNIGNTQVSNIVLKDDHDVKVTSVILKGNNILNSEKNVNGSYNLLDGLNVTLNPNEIVKVTVEQKIRKKDLENALKDDKFEIKNVAVATINDIEDTSTEKTEVKNRYKYTIEYRYNEKNYYYDETNQKQNAEVLKDDALEGTLITISKEIHYPDIKNGYEYMKYEVLMPEGKITSNEEINKIIIYYGKPDITITKYAPEIVDAGDEFIYTIEVENSGNKGTAVTVTDELPATTTYIKAVDGFKEPNTTDNKNLIWNINLEANSKETIKFKVKLDNDTVDTDIINTAGATYTCAGEKITKTSGDKKTQVKGITVNYNELKIGQKLDDVNVIFVLDNSSSMNYQAEGKAFDNPDIIVEGSFNDSTLYHIAPGDEEKTRLYAAKQAINSFINTFQSTDVAVITFNTKENQTKNLIHVVNSNGKTEVQFNDTNYKVEGQYMSTDGKEYDGIEVAIECGAIDRGSAYANDTISRTDLKKNISNISITSARGGLGTFICPALDMIINGQKTYLSDTKKNIVIIIADGVFEDEVDGTNPGIIADTRNSLLLTAKNNNKELEIYSVALGDSNHVEFNEQALKDLSTNGSCVTAGNTNTLLNKFKEIYSEATDNTDTRYSENGIVTIGKASKDIIVPGTTEVEGINDSIKVTYMNGEEEETLFECTSATQLQDLGLSIEEKNIYWNVNEYIRKQKIELPSSVFNLKYYIPLN